MPRATESHALSKRDSGTAPDRPTVDESAPEFRCPDSVRQAAMALHLELVAAVGRGESTVYSATATEYGITLQGAGRIDGAEHSSSEGDTYFGLEAEPDPRVMLVGVVLGACTTDHPPGGSCGCGWTAPSGESAPTRLEGGTLGEHCQYLLDEMGPLPASEDY